MNYPIRFDLKSGQVELWSGPVPRVGEYVQLPGRPVKRVKRVVYQYGERGLEYIYVRVVNPRKENV